MVSYFIFSSKNVRPLPYFTFFVIFSLVLSFFFTSLGESNKCEARFCNECQHELQSAASWLLVPYLLWAKKKLEICGNVLATKRLYIHTQFWCLASRVLTIRRAGDMDLRKLFAKMAGEMKWLKLVSVIVALDNIIVVWILKVLSWNRHKNRITRYKPSFS